jgi:hypothetical protein
LVESRPLQSDADHDPIAFAAAQRLTPDERLAEGLEWMRVMER